MKHRVGKICILIAVVGCLIMLSGWVLAEFNPDTMFSNNEASTPHEYSEALDKSAVINIEVDIEDVRVSVSNDGLLHIRYEDTERIKHSYSGGGSSVKLRTQTDNEKWYEIIRFNPQISRRAVYIELPEDFAGRLLVKATTGDIAVDGAASQAALDLTATTGAITLADCAANEAVMRTTNGEIRARELSASSLRIEFTTGGAVLDNVSSDIIDVRGTTGDIRFSGLVGQEIDMHASTGGIFGSISVDPVEFTITCNTSTGNSNLFSDRIGGERKLNVSTSTGDIRIDFAY